MTAQMPGPLKAVWETRWSTGFWIQCRGHPVTAATWGVNEWKEEDGFFCSSPLPFSKDLLSPPLVFRLSDK